MTAHNNNNCNEADRFVLMLQMMRFGNSFLFIPTRSQQLQIITQNKHNNKKNPIVVFLFNSFVLHDQEFPCFSRYGVGFELKSEGGVKRDAGMSLDWDIFTHKYTGIGTASHKLGQKYLTFSCSKQAHFFCIFFCMVHFTLQ